jgi:hypothetical protein
MIENNNGWRPILLEPFLNSNDIYCPCCWKAHLNKQQRKKATAVGLESIDLYIGENCSGCGALLTSTGWEYTHAHTQPATETTDQQDLTALISMVERKGICQVLEQLIVITTASAIDALNDGAEANCDKWEAYRKVLAGAQQQMKKL